MPSSPDSNIYKMLEHVYPCKDCIVKLQCVTYCYKLDFDESLLNKFKRTHNCSDCGNDVFEMYHSENFTIVIRCTGCRRVFKLGSFYAGPSEDGMRCAMVRDPATAFISNSFDVVTGKFILAEFKLMHSDIYDKD